MEEYKAKAVKEKEQGKKRKRGKIKRSVKK